MTFHTKPEIRFFARPAWLIFGFLQIGITLLYFNIFEWNALISQFSGNSYHSEDPDSLSLFIIMILFWGFLSGSYLIITWTSFHEKFLAKLIITDDEIIWKCIFKKSHTMQINSCTFVGVELESSFNKLDYPFIYFATTWYPKMYAHKIDKLKNSDQFIKFWCTDKLADYLIASLPKEKTGGLQYHRRCIDGKQKQQTKKKYR